MSKTIKIMDKFNHDKNVVRGTNETSKVYCPINNQAGMHSDRMFDVLFDNSEWVQHETSKGYFDVLGFVKGYPFEAEYRLKSATFMMACERTLSKDMVTDFENEIARRLRDEYVEADIFSYIMCGKNEFRCTLYYNTVWVMKNLG